jgi:hypothetical protein
MSAGSAQLNTIATIYERTLIRAESGSFRSRHTSSHLGWVVENYSQDSHNIERESEAIETRYPVTFQDMTSFRM